jgi:hypothetical protein
LRRLLDARRTPALIATVERTSLISAIRPLLDLLPLLSRLTLALLTLLFGGLSSALLTLLLGSLLLTLQALLLSTLLLIAH